MAEKFDENSAFVNGEIVPAADLPDSAELEDNEALIAARRIVADDDYVDKEYRESHSQGFLDAKQLIESGMQKSIADGFDVLRVMYRPADDQHPNGYWMTFHNLWRR